MAFKEWRRMRMKWLIVPLVILASGLLLSGARQEELTGELVRPAVTSADCSFLSNPDEFMPDAEMRYGARSDITKRLSMYVSAMSPAGEALDAASVPRKNFIDDAIFNRMAGAGIPSAPIASDAEFLRRVTLASSFCFRAPQAKPILLISKWVPG